MANTNPEENKAATPVQGARGAAETSEQVQSEQLTAETPAYVTELLKSNEEVIKSNQLVIDAIDQFKDTAGEVFKDAVLSLSKGASASDSKTQEEEVEIDPKAKYVVASDMSFRDSKDFNKVHKSGDDVSGFDHNRLAHLLRTGHVVKKAK